MYLLFFHRGGDRMKIELYVRIRPRDKNMKDVFWNALDNDEKFKGESGLFLYKGDTEKDFDHLFMIRKLDDKEVQHIKDFLLAISDVWHVRVRSIDPEPWMPEETVQRLIDIYEFNKKLGDIAC